MTIRWVPVQEEEEEEGEEGAPRRDEDVDFRNIRDG